jgi:hypothetical protein
VRMVGTPVKVGLGGKKNGRPDPLGEVENER